MTKQSKSAPGQIKAADFEEKVWAIEGVRVILRADPDSLVKDYGYKNAADETWRVTELIDKRIEKCVGNIPTVIVQGDGEQPHGRVILRTVKNGYKS